ncbi:MAG: hypothetical protein ACI8XO_000469 [Verrucomicrobiales bacterium]|jgi:hypothetical protein
MSINEISGQIVDSAIKTLDPGLLESVSSTSAPPYSKKAAIA